MSTHSKRSKNSHLRSALHQSALSQRDQLKAVVLTRFLRDYAHGNSHRTKIISHQVDHFFQHQKVTEDSLRALKFKIAQLQFHPPNKVASVSVQVNQPDPTAVKQPELPEKAVVPTHLPAIKAATQRPVAVPNRKQIGSRSSKSSKYSNSVARSVYVADGDADDEWATLVRFDAQLFKKEKQLQKLKENETKKRLKADLDLQLKEKEEKRKAEENQNKEFYNIQEEQGQAFDKRQKQISDEMQRKIILQKKMRDKQVKEERKRRMRQERDNAKLQKQLVVQIKEELNAQKLQILRRKQQEKERFHQLMIENEENQRRLKQEQQRERAEDVRLQEEYSRLLQQQEEKREKQKMQREKRTKGILSTYQDSVMKDREEHIRVEDEKMMRYIKQAEQRHAHEKELKREAILRNQQEMREMLAKQVEEKKEKKVLEQEANRIQGQIWREDYENYRQHQQEKKEYMKGVQGRHKEELQWLMNEKQRRSRNRKMNTLQLLYNKALIKQAGKLDQNHLRKEKVK